MPRPRKCRRLEKLPEHTYFKPAGIPLRDLEEECLSLEECEAVRLKDIEGLDQEECGERMGISRATFQRVLNSARRKIARALTEGKALRIEGGHYTVEGHHDGGDRCCRRHQREHLEDH